ncbi:MAG: hypothetical protein KME26_04390 [Oscillatoria princeps RMCB-10]|nr:hypothetical protein [Oscillatoria princeps RMCB-10]
MVACLSRQRQVFFRKGRPLRDLTGLRETGACWQCRSRLPDFMPALPLPTEEAKHYNIVNFKDPPADIFLRTGAPQPRAAKILR